MEELGLRIRLLLQRSRSSPSPVAVAHGAARELTYEAFLAVATEEVGRSPVALAVVRLPLERHNEGALLLQEELRGRDSMGEYRSTHLLILMPEMTAAAARLGLLTAQVFFAEIAVNLPFQELDSGRSLIERRTRVFFQSLTPWKGNTETLSPRGVTSGHRCQ